MDIALVNLEVLALSALVVGLYALKPRAGLAPLYVGLGLLIAFTMMGGRVKAVVPVLAGPETPYTSLVGLSALLTGLALIYTLEGTSEARRAVVAVGITSMLLYLLRLALAYHLTRPGGDLTVHGRTEWIDPRLWPSVVSSIAYMVDGIAIIVIYQALHNAARWLPRVVQLSLAIVGAMVVDALVYGGLSGNFDPAQVAGQLVGKTTAGVAASIPAALFIARQLRSYSEQMRDGVLERRAFEIMDLRRQVRDIQTELKRSQAEYQTVRDLFARYVVPDVVDEILRDTTQVKLGGENREVTILFSDIRGYSTLSEHMSPEATIALLNRYFGAMSELINVERGTIIEFEGDAILTVFGAPLDQPDHAARAVRTARAMLARVAQLNQEWETDGTAAQWEQLQLGAFRIRLGIHSGEVVVGNVGSESRAKYAVIGDTVNTAARVESLNKDLRTTLLATEATVRSVHGALALDWVDLGAHAVRGRRETVHVYTLRELLGEDGSEPSVDSD